MEEKMKKDNYKDDVKLITFCRRAVALPEDEKELSVDAMSTDYFDIIIKQDFDTKSELIDITKSKNNVFKDSHNIAMHSYPIYCSESDVKRYSNSNGYSDPFVKSSDKPFLSIIQVHITPEVMARICMGETSDKYMDIFSYDIHKIIDRFAQDNNSFVYRVYRSLSVGDFIVVIRSIHEDTSFRISTLLRRRTAKNDDDKTNIKLVMYKTYTVLSIYNTAIQVENIKGDKGRFIIRGCFSNRYWSNKVQNDNKLKAIKSEIDNNISRLNGRYDISVALTREEFMKISPLIAKYKGNSDCKVDELENEMKNWNPTINGFNIMSYLGYMLCNGYLSYINVRYLISFDEPDFSFVDEIDNEIVVHAKRDDECYLDGKNNKIYCILYKKFKEVENAVNNMQAYRKNITYYMLLVGRLIEMCRTINGLSDTRIYSYILMNQLGIVLDSVESYLKVLAENKSFNIRIVMDNLEEYLRLAVHALDSYACYIRNNNLQALQAPNYNLEGSFSVEKYLIGYGEFLKEIIGQYNKIAKNSNIGELRQNLVPVFEPDSLHNAMSINVLFRELDGIRFNSGESRIMLVRCSTFKEIVNIPEITAALFHETAHQFRYESRKKRNDSLIKYSISLYFEIIVLELVRIAKQDLPWLNPDEDSICVIKQQLVNSYLCKIYDSDTDLKYSYENESLYSFKRSFLDDLSAIYDKTMLINNVRQCLDCVIKEVKFKLDIFDNDICESIKKLASFEADIKALHGKKNKNDNFLEIIEETKKAVKCMSENSNSSEVEHIFDDLLDELEMYAENSEKFADLASLEYSMEDVWCDAYDKLTEKWDKKEDGYDEGIGRYLGLDYRHEDSKREFVKQMNNVSFMARYNIPNKIEENIEQYREITADMFMCKLMGLSAFGYLDYIMRDTPVDVDISSEYLIRFIYVLCVCYKAKDHKVFFKNFRKETNDGVKALNEAYRRKTGKILWTLDFDNIGGDNNDELNELELLGSECARIAGVLYNDNDQTEIDYEYGAEYAHYNNMYLLLSNIYVSWKSILAVFDNSLIRQDLEEGNEMLEKMNQYFPDDALKKACHEFAEYWNNPNMRYGIESEGIEKLNHSIIQFIQHMYYKNKFRNAEECYKWGNVDANTECTA